MKNYIVIGGSTGIGVELVKLLEEEGSKVIATYNTNFIPDRENVKYLKHDVLNDDLEIDDFPEEIHGLAYCPGSINLKPFHRFSEKDFIDDFKFQVLGATNVIKQLLSKMKKSKNSSIVLFSTIAVQSGFSFHSQVSMSKGAIEGLTLSLAAEFAPKIKVNCIAPSLTDSKMSQKMVSNETIRKAIKNMHPIPKIGNGEDFGDLASFLLGEKNNWITGQIFHIDGGRSTLRIKS